MVRPVVRFLTEDILQIPVSLFLFDNCADDLRHLLIADRIGDRGVWCVGLNLGYVKWRFRRPVRVGPICDDPQHVLRIVVRPSSGERADDLTWSVGFCDDYGFASHCCFVSRRCGFEL